MEDQFLKSAFIRMSEQNKEMLIEERKAEFVISNDKKDRHSTILNPEGWLLDNYNKNGIVGYQHEVHSSFSNDPDKVIGIGAARVEGPELIGVVTFEPAEVNPFAEKIYKKVLFGSLKAASVGFAAVGRGNYGTGTEAFGADNQTYYFEGQELLEWSIVNIPSNPSAVIRKAKQYKGKYYTEEELQEIINAKVEAEKRKFSIKFLK